MNFDDAISAHASWKIKLRLIISKASDEKLDPNNVEKDNQCELGKWIYGDGSKHKSFPEYEELRLSHAKFHKCAADIIRKAQAGIANEAMIENGSDYASASSAVVTNIMKMKRKAQN